MSEDRSGGGGGGWGESLWGWPPASQEQHQHHHQGFTNQIPATAQNAPSHQTLFGYKVGNPGTHFSTGNVSTGYPSDLSHQQQNSAAAHWWYSTSQQLQEQPQHHSNVTDHSHALIQQRGKLGKNSKGDAKPRGRMTAYAFFVQICREEHKKKHPQENVVFAEFSKRCAERWKTMSEKEKKRFHELAEKDKKRYENEMKEYNPTDEKGRRIKKRKQMKDPNAPKRSLSAFFLFCNDERKKVKGENPDYGVGDISKELGRRWADTSPTLKSKYEGMAEKDKARYEREMTAYKKKGKCSIGTETDLIKKETDDDNNINGQENGDESMIAS